MVPVVRGENFSSPIPINRYTAQLFEIEPEYSSSPAAVSAELLGCTEWTPIQRSALFQLAHVCFFIGYLSPIGEYGSLLLRLGVVLGYLLHSTWAWNVICAPSVFTWSFVLVILNVAQCFHTLYQLRTVRFASNMEALYVNLFQPFQLSRKNFNKLTSTDYCHIVTLYSGEAYAVENITRTDRLGLLLNGRMQVSYENRPLHCIFEHEFLDSAEFHSSSSLRENNRFTVSIVALTECEIMIWDRADIEYLMTKNTYLKTIMESLVAKDILLKLTILGNQISGWRSHQSCDLRLAQKKSFVSALCAINRNLTQSGASTPDGESNDYNFLEDDSISPDAIKRCEPIRQSPLSLACSGNIELAQWYHAFLKKELISGKPSTSFLGGTKISF